MKHHRGVNNTAKRRSVVSFSAEPLHRVRVGHVASDDFHACTPQAVSARLLRFAAGVFARRDR